MTLLNYADQVVVRAFEKHAEVNGIIIPDYNEFFASNDMQYIQELIYLYSSYEDLLLLTVASTLIMGVPDDFDSDVEFKKKPALYLKFCEYELLLYRNKGGDIPTTKDDQNWMMMSAEAHYQIQLTATAMGYFGVAKKAKNYRKQLRRYLGLK